MTLNIKSGMSKTQHSLDELVRQYEQINGRVGQLEGDLSAMLIRVSPFLTVYMFAAGTAGAVTGFSTWPELRSITGAGVVLAHPPRTSMATVRLAAARRPECILFIRLQTTAARNGPHRSVTR